MVDKSTGILQPWAPNGAPGGDDGGYRTGPAVYMRYLVSAFANMDLRKILLTPDYQKFLEVNAENVLLNPDRPQSRDPIVDLTNDLAILVAAIVMLRTLSDALPLQLKPSAGKIEPI